MAEGVKLPNGRSIPLLGLGTWLSDKGKAGEAVKYALEIGYRHLDFAHGYLNEDEIGDYMQDVFKNGTVKREDVFLTSKLWCSYFAKDDVVPACELTLKNLKVDYLDLYLAHLPFRLEKHVAMNVPVAGTGIGLVGYSVELMKETWQQMELLVEKGLCKSIGVSNFTVKKLKELLKFAKIKPACNQVELHPYLPQNELLKFCEENGIVVVAYSPLGAPARPGIFVGEKDPCLLDDPTIAEVAKKHNCSAAQVLLKWGMQRKTPVIPKSVTPSRILQNFEAQNVNLDAGDLAKIDAIATRHRYVTQAWALCPNQTLEELWDSEYLG